MLNIMLMNLGLNKLKHGQPIQHLKYFKFLAILFDENLTWKCHINMVTNKLSKVIGILSRLKHVYLYHALLSIYHSFFCIALEL